MNREKKTFFHVTGMSCGGCEAAAKNTASRLPGYVDATFDAKANSGVVVGDVDPNAVIAALAKVGYTASLQDAQPPASVPQSYARTAGEDTADHGGRCSPAPGCL